MDLINSAFKSFCLCSFSLQLHGVAIDITELVNVVLYLISDRYENEAVKNSSTVHPMDTVNNLQIVQADETSF